MDGVTIIEEIVHHKTTIDCVIILGVMTTIFFCVIIASILDADNVNTYMKALFSGILGSLVLCCWLLLITSYYDTTPYYKVSVNESVSFVEFTDKYEIVEHNDNGFYTVYEKDKT